MSTPQQLSDWLNGTPTGGPNGDGRYPLVYEDGTTHLIYCPAAQALGQEDEASLPQLYAEDAEASAQAAQASATAAAASAASIGNAEQNSAASATAAATSATNAHTSETNAGNSATAAAGSAGTAAGSATAAGNSATAAAGSATTAGTQATNAAASATAASGSATNAHTSETNAATSASAASGSASAASGSATTATTQATNAAGSASAASGSATAAANSATAAAGSATAAANSVASIGSSVSDAAASASAAAQSKSDASGFATNASNSAAAAAASAASVNQANIVHIAGAETISGAKTFQANVALDPINCAAGFMLNGAGNQLVYNGAATATWAATVAVALNAVYAPKTYTGYCYICIQAGTTAGAEPVWPTVAGATVTDGTVIWQIRAHYFASGAGGGVALFGGVGGMLGVTNGGDQYILSWAAAGINYRSPLNALFGTAGTQVIYRRLSWGTGSSRWAEVMEANASYSLYAYDATGALLGNPFNLTQAGQVFFTSSGQSTTVFITDTGANGANLTLRGNGSTTPNKILRAQGGKLEFVNSAYSAVIATLTDVGAWVTNDYLQGSRVLAGYDSGQLASMNCSNWFRSSGNTGWYSASYGGGVFCQDTTYVRAYNGFQMAAADFVITSDRRMKAGIRPFVFRGRLKPREFVMRRDGKPDFGFVAQDVQELYPEAVGEMDGILQLSYPKLTAILAHQTNKAEDDILALQRQLAAMQTKLDHLSTPWLIRGLKAIFSRNH